MKSNKTQNIITTFMNLKIYLTTFYFSHYLLRGIDMNYKLI